MTSTPAATMLDEPVVNLSSPAPPLRIDPARVVLNASGFACKTYFVRLPRGMVADDLKRPEIWASVQASSQKAFRKFDHVTMIGYDESWLAEAIVGAAGGTQVVLARLKVTALPHQRYDQLPQDDQFKVEWNGVGFVVQRKSDGHMMTSAVATVQAAERDLHNQYSRKA